MEESTVSWEVSGVLITPAELRFPDAVPGETYRATLRVQNLQHHSRLLCLLPPQQPQFRLITENPRKTVAFGLLLTATVEYHPDREEDLRDRLLLGVGDKTVEIPIIGLIPRCHLEIEPEINFGTVVANSKVINAGIKITNHGSYPGAFHIKYRGNVPIVITPARGVVEPKGVQLVIMEIGTDLPRIINEPAIVELQGRDNARIIIKANIVEQVLELLGLPYSDRIGCVHFGCVYFGTSKTEQVILHNKSPESMDWVAVLQDNAAGTEMGTDLQKSTDAVLKDLQFTERKQEQDVSTLISCTPNEGTLKPYQKILITLCFSPRQLKRDPEFYRTPPRQDYALFLNFEAIGTKDDFLQTLNSGGIPINEKNPRKVELGLTGSGLPVKLTFSSGLLINFMECFMGEQTDILCTLKNECNILPVSFAFHKIPHFNIDPPKGKIKPQAIQDVVFSFIPRHVGTFIVKQVVDIIGPVTTKDGVLTLKMEPFHHINLSFSGQCKSVTNRAVIKTYPGHKTEQCGDMVRWNNVPPVARLKADKTQIHAHRINRGLSSVAIALPDDRPASLMPTEMDKDFRTIFTRVSRYNFMDPEYSYTKMEEIEKQANKDYYKDYIRNLRQRRTQKKTAKMFEKFNNPVDIGLHPASGLKSPKVKYISQEKLDERTDFVNGTSLLTSQKLAEIESKSVIREVLDGLNPVPSSPQEVDDCSLIFMPKQLRQILIGPSTINFGDVCVCSTSTRKLHIVNHLPFHVWIQAEIDSEELQQSGPLRHVMPPCTKTYITIVFKSDKLGHFQKSFTYTINQNHTGHVVVVGDVVPVSLELSAREVTLHPSFSFLADTELRTTVTLYNRKNYPAEFTWKPIITDRGMAFSICPDKGMVEACKDLECEVVWRSGFSSPITGEFDLFVHKGKPRRLKCFAKPGPTCVQFKDQRITFNHAPLHLTTTKIAILQNVGHNHAYFQVIDANPIPGMIIAPYEGVIPVGGRTELKIYFTPNALMKFDSRVEVAVRHGKTLALRIGGSVDVPDIDISVFNFNFSGVYVGSFQKIPFFIENKGKAHAKVTLDLSNHNDFQLQFSLQPDACYSPDNPCLYCVDVEPNSALEASLSFSPKEVAAYDFTLPIKVNLSQISDNNIAYSAGSAKHIIVPRPQLLIIPTLECKVQAIALQSLLEVSPLDLVFQYSFRSLNLGVMSDSKNRKKLKLKNTSNKQLTWKLDLDAAGQALDDGIFKFSLHTGILSPGQYTIVSVFFCPLWPGIYTAEVPVYLNDETSLYRVVTLSGSLKSPKISFDPPFLILTPVPLNMKSEADISIIPQNFVCDSYVQVQIPDFEDDDDPIKPLTVDFPNGNAIKVTPEGKNVEVICHVSFISPKPLSFLKNIVFIDGEKTRYSIQVSATAENCLLTVYPYLARHLTDQQIILSSDDNKIIYNIGETLQNPCYVPGKHSQTPSSTSFCTVTDSPWENSPAEFECSPESERSKKCGSISRNERIRSKLEQSVVPDEDTEEYAFFQKVTTTVQNWFTLFGWSKGPNPISIPYTLRRDVCKIQMTSTDEKVKLNLGRDVKTIYDMLLNLSGQLLPGITTSQSLPFDPIQRVVQLQWQHATMIAFLGNQGASLSHVLPQFLLDLCDFKKWTHLQLLVQAKDAPDENNPVFVLDDCVFEALSKRAWTDVLLQIYKILVLQRVSVLKVKHVSSSEEPENPIKTNADPLSSNIYSSSEKILLTWLNRNYEKARKVVWKDCKKGDTPPQRWIVNFDRDLLDGLVLAAQVASYCPYLISTHLVNMYTHPKTPEQFLHNCLIVVNSFHIINLDMDILAADICDPNPITMLILCVYLYEHLPQYFYKKCIEFEGPLHATVLRKIRLKNPSVRPLVYSAALLGREAGDFSLPKGNTVTIPPKGQISVKVVFTSRFLYPSEAVLLFVSKPLTGVGGTTLTFSLKAKISVVKLSGTLKCRSPCYELKTVNLQVMSPFKMDGPFRVILVESTSFIVEPDQLHQASQIKQGKMESSETNIENTCNIVGVEGSNKERDNSVATKQSTCFQEFYSPMDAVFLNRESSATLELHYLPFCMGKRYCAIILVNEQNKEVKHTDVKQAKSGVIPSDVTPDEVHALTEIGEFVYLVEGTCGLPLPSGLLPMDSPNILYISSQLEGQSEGDPVLFLKCCVKSQLEEYLKIPLINEAREKALALAAQQCMSAAEYERRKVTGTLESSSVRVAVAALGLSTVEDDFLQNFPDCFQKCIEYSVEVSMPEYFVIPEKIYIPVLASSRVNNICLEKESDYSAQDTEDAAVELPIKFLPRYPGRYPCHILLQSSYDIRMYKIECVVNTDTAEAQLQFVTPAYQAVVQDIPITNLSQQDWKLTANLKGRCFYGPPLIYVAAGETTIYTLTFRPIAECVTKGKLILQNATDGTDHVFILKGIATKPLALDHIVIDCQVRQITQKVLMVPNFTKNTLQYKVFSDLSIINGESTLTVEPDDTAAYTLNISPWKRGTFKGVISFVPEDGEQRQGRHNFPERTDGMQKLSTQPLQTVTAANTEKSPSCCRVWFSLEIYGISAPPERTLNVECTVLDSVVVGIPITNPTNEVLQLDVQLIDSSVLTGERCLVLEPGGHLHYEVKYSPAVTGDSDGSVIFLSERIGEFWYALKLHVKKPRPTTFPEVECELGKWVRQYILLRNPTYEILELKILNSNPSHFSVELDSKPPLVVAPHSTTEVPVLFYPSGLGRTSHKATVTFTCPQLEQWVFYFSGVGLIPQPQDPTSVSSRLGYHSSVIITFKNPTFEPVLVDVILTVSSPLRMNHFKVYEQEGYMLPAHKEKEDTEVYFPGHKAKIHMSWEKGTYGHPGYACKNDWEHLMNHPSASDFHHSSKESIFWLPLKQKQDISLSPKSKLDIPVLFAPQTMILYEAVLVVQLAKNDAEFWPYDDSITLTDENCSTITEDKKIKGLRWIYPINGIPEAPPSKSAPAVVRCRARSRVEERVEVLLTGVVPGIHGSKVTRDPLDPSKCKSVIIRDEVQVTEGFFTVDEFIYEIQFESERVRSQLKPATAINLVKKDRDLKTGIVILVFNVVFAPNKPIRNQATLVVQCNTGGIWKFPILFIATEPEVDDVINIEAVGLNKESLVSFRLTSQTRHPEPYMAYFLQGSDPEFAVSPQAGELLPLDSAGTRLAVAFKPNMYSRKHRATLVIQTAAMQWMYEINGLPPETIPPTSSSKVDCKNPYVRSTTVQQRNFVHENMKLLCTGVSSTIKGTPLILRAK